MAKLTINPKTAKAATGSEHHDFAQRLLRRVMSTLWVLKGDDPDANYDRQEEMRAAMLALAAFKPQDEIEGMMAAQAVALNAATMECLRRAMIPDQPAEFHNQLLKNGANLARAFSEVLNALDRKRGKHRQQTVRVEKVTVQAGGQAIVGNVAPGAGRQGGGGYGSKREAEPRETPARLAHDATPGAGMPPLRGKKPGRKPLPVSGDAGQKTVPPARRGQHRAANG